MPQSNIYIVNIESFDMAHGNFSNELEILGVFVPNLCWLTMIFPTT